MNKLRNEFEKGNKVEALKMMGDTFVKDIGKGLMDFFQK